MMAIVGFCMVPSRSSQDPSGYLQYNARAGRCPTPGSEVIDRVAAQSASSSSDVQSDLALRQVLACHSPWSVWLRTDLSVKKGGFALLVFLLVDLAAGEPLV